MEILWESFRYPSDTFLPGMIMDGIRLTSWLSPSDPAAGTYSLELENQNQNQYFIRLVGSVEPYWSSRTQKTPLRG